MFSTPYTRPQLYDMVAELRRELAMRDSVYPRLIEARKLAHGEAERRMEALRRAQWILEALIKHSAQHPEVLGGRPLPVAIQGKELHEQ